MCLVVYVKSTGMKEDTLLRPGGICASPFWMIESLDREVVISVDGRVDDIQQP